MAPVGIHYRSNTYQNIGCKFNKGCIIFLICKNNRLKLQYLCICRYQSYQWCSHYPSVVYILLSHLNLFTFILHFILLLSNSSLPSLHSLVQAFLLSLVYCSPPESPPNLIQAPYRAHMLWLHSQFSHTQSSLHIISCV